MNNIIKAVKTLDDAVFAVELANGFAIACERADEGLKYRLIDNNEHCTIYCDEDGVLVETGKPVMFSRSADQKIKDFSSSLPNPHRQWEKAFTPLYDQIMEPLHFAPVRRRNYEDALQILGISITAPISIPAYLAWKTFKRELAVDGTPIILPLLSIPLQAPWAIRELVHPSVKGVKITNPEVLEATPKDATSYVAIGDYGRFNPAFFGDASSAKSPGACLRIVLSDGLDLTRGNAFYPYNGNHFGKAKHFLRTDPRLIATVHVTYAAMELFFKDRHAFRAGIDHYRAREILRSAERL